jgi:hypothetical protein
MRQQNLYKTCPKCDKPGIEKPAEILPDKGLLIKVIHDDGSSCEFEEYSSIDSFLKRKRKKRDPKIIDRCPVCGDEGRIASYRPKRDKQFHTWKYFVVHEQIDGYWGKTHKNKKRRRCYITTESQRNEILKRLGRYTS